MPKYALQTAIFLFVYEIRGYFHVLEVDICKIALSYREERVLLKHKVWGFSGPHTWDTWISNEYTY